MKVLFLPYNVASMPAITANAINAIDGYEAKYLNTVAHHYVAKNPCEIKLYPYFKNQTFKVNPLLFFLSNLEKITVFPIRYLFSIYYWIKWADIVHWTWGAKLPLQLDLRIAKWLKKKRFIEWVGSDIRVPEVTMQESKWYKDVFCNGYEYAKIENKAKSYKIQTIFHSLGYKPILVPEMQLFLKPGLFSEVYTTQYRIFEEKKYDTSYYPKLQNDKIVIVHSPSAIKAKGSDVIIPIIEKLKKKYPIEFILLHGVSREVVLNTMKSCDIFIDQIILGSYAAAAIEAMSFGKPVVAYIMPSVHKQGIPIDCPIINANPDSIESKLTEVIENPELRYNIGVKSRKYVENFHNADRLSMQLIDIYNGKCEPKSII
jgi:hypothetical protein